MTVSNTGKDGYGQEMVWCVWFEKTKKFDDTFEPEILMIAPPETGNVTLRRG